MAYQPLDSYQTWWDRLIPTADRPPRHWPIHGSCYLLRGDDDGYYVQIWQHNIPRFNSGSFARLCDALRWRRLSIRAWDTELTPEEEAFVEQGRISMEAG